MSTAWFLVPIAGVLYKAWLIACPRVWVRWEFKKTDCWVGVYWKVTPRFDGTVPNGEWIDIWICLLPMLPLHIDWPRGGTPREVWP